MGIRIGKIAVQIFCHGLLLAFVVVLGSNGCGSKKRAMNNGSGKTSGTPRTSPKVSSPQSPIAEADNSASSKSGSDSQMNHGAKSGADDASSGKGREISAGSKPESFISEDRSLSEIEKYLSGGGEALILFEGSDPCTGKICKINKDDELLNAVAKDEKLKLKVFKVKLNAKSAQQFPIFSSYAPDSDTSRENPWLVLFSNAKDSAINDQDLPESNDPGSMERVKVTIGTKLTAMRVRSEAPPEAARKQEAKQNESGEIQKKKCTDHGCS